ncbi:MAG: DNA mismatch repair protein MutS [Armatimonadota bacterium]|nr:DNA mismatch repair protein MutS [Armatimonadota bacterium]MDR7586979.1 DNA mismatch repair protein MutS [Armatimonadota bacterium]MDR7612373.1 DNA mismatch repair protein MutS [Armatimonadota bacterium]
MKARLLYPNKDFDWRWAQLAAAERANRRAGIRSRQLPDFDPCADLPPNAEDLQRDLDLTPLFSAMAQDDDWIFEVSRRVLLEAVHGDLEIVRYRQAVLQDCLEQPDVVRQLYNLAVEVTEGRRGHYLGVLSRYPDWVLRDAHETLSDLLRPLRTLHQLVTQYAPCFRAEGWHQFFTTIQGNLSAEYLTEVEGHLHELEFLHGVLLSAELGPAHKGTRYRLHRIPKLRRGLWDWWRDLFGAKPSVYRFELSPRDEAGAQALGELRSRAIASAAEALGQAASHVRDFFAMLRAELAFYIGCLNLHSALTRQGYHICFPQPAPVSERRLSFHGLYDASLALTIDRPVIPNDLHADGKMLLMITGPNSGGKTTFLRSLGVAQLLMQAGALVPARSFTAALCAGLFTHFRRVEDIQLQSGKFDEELARMSGIVDHLRSDSLLLCNESFSATNEREGSEIARQFIQAVTEIGVRVYFVTHFYELARSLYEKGLESARFLCAERLQDGRRTYRILEGEPLATAYGGDVYQRIFSVFCGVSR